MSVKLLQIETATKVCSVAISIDGETRFLREEEGQNLHASRLTPLISGLMEEAGLKFGDLHAVAVSKGPGSYTGLRIGVSTAKGLCFAADIPLIAIETLQMMASGYASEAPGAAWVCPMIDARRMEVYTALFDGTGARLKETAAKIIDEESFRTALAAQNLVFLGDGAEKCRAVLNHPNAQFVSGNFNSAAHMSALAFTAWREQTFEDVAYFEPFYLKDFVVTPSKKKLL
ncbi:tRNA (adenosine(37)-N6)-threonylcarbamoyltransferase complex dimerization subunit type 1 TsaB [Pedobacter yulinensis]|uniref:tRNA (Adenosine(37)-N6)-threonylcarbamoyltransferase complex dimerization subunit type 1 TsaB n=1 Tax=Pedobacter yulinensis TaxID=2126353 RepID=A0A2T3HI78_9SPHI|nr:tRNA (adenosine(37)-N6)-threonylcarbamoyltransferase complex dimerization subunit type 1 TsaB [Pedobacter yulinensis]PST82156.1 tRNA (adenosine(37)-N6)-threonylcarbamoyltransferase complex dimerization subunit type 1 TsaB [Pedobacter yulinensis]